MTKIRKLYYFDKKNAGEMISFLDNSDSYVNHIMFNPLTPLHHILPLRFKFLPESYVLKDYNEMKGIVTVAPSKNPKKQVEIQKLLFEENCYSDAAELIQYVVSKYKAMGTASVIARIDDYLPELIKVFVSKCGFSQISYEKLWKYPESKPEEKSENNFNSKRFREFRNSDAPYIASLYNEQLLPHFRPLLGKEISEFKDVLFSGLSYYSEYKYIYRDSKTKKTIACLIIKTSDNENYILDIIQSMWDIVDVNELIAFALYSIKKRKRNAKLFIKSKKYIHQGETLEKEFIDQQFECVQNKLVLTNSSARIIKDENQERKYTVLGQFYGGISVANRTKINLNN